jgi:hypothetical protein
MKLNYKILSILLVGMFFTQCTSDFNDLNVDPTGFSSDEVSGKFFLTGPQVRLYGPDRFPYWRANLIHADRYAGHFTFGFRGCWWSDELGYSYNSGYTDASWNWLAGYIGQLDNYIKLVRPGGEFENQYMHAIGTIMRGLYFQMYTDIFGMIPYSEAVNPDITLPKYDDQATIYQGIIAELDEAMSTIGDATKTGDNVDDVGDNDLYFNGDLQKWKRLANTLKLRVAMRAYGAPGASFATTAISQALNAPLLESDDALLPKDEVISQWASASYGDVYYNFGRGSDWKVGKTLIDALRDNNDPRLDAYADPAPGGTVEITQPAEGPDATLHQKRLDFILGILQDAGVDYTVSTDGLVTTITMPENAYYVGQPSRLNGQTQPYAAWEFFSKPDEYVIRRKNSGSISPEIILTSAEAYFLRAEAAVRGIGSDDANEMYQKGIERAMKLWNVSDGDIGAFLAESPMGSLSGSMEEMIEKIATQRWIAGYTDGFEAWAVVRDMGYPKVLADGVTDVDLYGPGDINGKYPQRMRYGNNAINTNGSNVDQAISIQGPNQQDTKLWWAK